MAASTFCGSFYFLVGSIRLSKFDVVFNRIVEKIYILKDHADMLQNTIRSMQARRVHARYMLGMKVKDIAAMEGITPSQAGKSIHAALRRLRRYFARQKWTVKL